MKIAIYTRSMNYDLFKISSETIQLPYIRKRCTFSSADGYLYHNLLNNDFDFIINIDEDAFIIDNNKLSSLLEYVIDNEYVNCGMPDGGVVDIRKHNPLVTNPFFNILNVREIRKKFNLVDIVNNYSHHNPDFENFSPQNLMKNKYAFDYFEPYNAFFVWLTVNFKTLFLDAEVHQDGISTILKDHVNEPFLFHSWYSRFYGNDVYHTERIKKLYTEVTGRSIPLPNFSSKLINLKDQIGNKIYYPIKLKVERKLKF